MEKRVQDVIGQLAAENAKGYERPTGGQLDAVNDEAVIVLTIRNSRVQPPVRRPPVHQGRQNNVMWFLQQVCDGWPTTINGTFAFECHDVSRPLSDRDAARFTFCTPQDAEHSEHGLPWSTKGTVLMPDEFAMLDYFGDLKSVDALPYRSKRPVAYFAGTTTGSRDASKNLRLMMCEWVSRHPGLALAHITKVAQLTESQVIASFPNARSWFRPYVSIPEQREYKYLFSVDGNAAAWNRFPWILNSNSICLKQRSRSVTWYSPLLQDGVNYFEFDKLDELEIMIPELRAMKDEVAEQMIGRNKLFVQEYLSPEAHRFYMGSVLALLT